MISIENIKREIKAFVRKSSNTGSLKVNFYNLESEFAERKISKQEYEKCESHCCGMCCIKMILITKNIQISIYELCEPCSKYEGYLYRNNDIKGLYYKGAVEMLKIEFSIKSDIAKYLSIRGIIYEINNNNFVIASVGSNIHKSNSIDTKPGNGGHLVLITGYDKKQKNYFSIIARAKQIKVKLIMRSHLKILKNTLQKEE